MAETPVWLEEARAVQEAVMIDRCRIDREVESFDRATGKTTRTWESVYEGPCRFPRADAAMRVEVTGMTVTPAQPTVKVPWDVQGLRGDDRITCVDSATPESIGRVLWLTDASPRTFQSAVTLTCREVRGGKR